MKNKPHSVGIDALLALDDEALLDAVQRQTFRFFIEGCEPQSGMARDRTGVLADAESDLVAIGGTGFGVMAIIVGVERGWISRDEALDRLERMIATLLRSTSYHGMFPHFMHGANGGTWPFSRKDDGGDIVETALLMQGLLCARAYFAADEPRERSLRLHITWMWEDIEWSWYTRGRKALTWHWSPNNGFVLDHEIRGWNECLLTYVMAAGAPKYGIDPSVYHEGYAMGRNFLNKRSFFDITLPLGIDMGGPLFFTHYSFCGLDPRGLSDRYADYWAQNVAHARINHAWCVANPGGYAGYGPDCWGLTASDDPAGYDAHMPGNDNGTISPTAAVASLCYTPEESMRAIRHFLSTYRERIWGRFGFADAFNPGKDWFAQTYLAIDQGPIVVMLENYRSGLLWKLFMSVPEIRIGLTRLGFSSPHLAAPTA